MIAAARPGVRHNALVTPSTPLRQTADSGLLGGSPVTATFPSATTAGNLLVAVIGGSNYVNTAMPSGWTKLGGQFGSSTDGDVELWYRLAAPSVTSVTLSADNFGTMDLFVMEFQSAATSAHAAGVFNHPADGATLTSTYTPSAAGLAVLAASSRFADYSITNFTGAVPAQGYRCKGYFLVTAAGVAPAGVITELDPGSTNWVMGVFL